MINIQTRYLSQIHINACTQTERQTSTVALSRSTCFSVTRATGTHLSWDLTSLSHSQETHGISNSINILTPFCKGGCDTGGLPRSYNGTDSNTVSVPLKCDALVKCCSSYIKPVQVCAWNICAWNRGLEDFQLKSTGAIPFIYHIFYRIVGINYVWRGILTHFQHILYY